MSYFLIYFILNILLILFKISSQNQNNISLNETKQINPYIYNSIKAYISSIKKDPKVMKDVFKLIPVFFNGEAKNVLKKTIDDIYNNTKYIDELFKLIKKNVTILDYILIGINNTKGYSGILKIVHSISHYHNEIIELLLNLTNERPEILDLLKLTSNNNIDYILYFLSDRGLLELIKKIVLIIIKNKTFIDNIFGILEDNKLIAIFENKNRTKEDIHKIIKEIFNSYAKNETIINTVKSVVGIYFQNEMKELRLTQIIISFLRLLFLFYTKINEVEMHSGLSPGCLEFLNYTFLGHMSDEIKKNSTRFVFDKEISQLYLFKLFVDSTKDKNDFIVFYNCLHSKPLFNISVKNDNILEHQPAFVITIVELINLTNLTEIKNINKSSTYFEDYYFTFGFCFPQGKEVEKNTFKNPAKNNSYDYYVCKNSDYEYLSKLILSNLFIVNGKDDIKVKAIEIRKEKQSINILKLLAELIPLFIFLIPVFIDIFLFFYKTCVIGMKKKTLMFEKSNQIIGDDENDNEEEDDNDKKVINKKRKNIKFVKLVPRWYKILDEFFSLKNNVKELFCFSTDVTNINNNTGLVYITGLIGISILLMIIGQLYLVLLNMPTKDFGKHQFFELISNPLYIFPFIGLRYSPRILSSCNGFTLTHKFLSYISQNSGCKHIFKFTFGQFYKYLILINLILFARYSMQYLIFIISDEETPMWRIFHEVELSQPKQINTFIYKILLKIVYYFDKNKFHTHDFMDYYWVSFNEVLFFLIGISLLSIGYKCKIKIDYFILFLILLIYVGKIILYYIFNKEEIKYFTTIYYYLFDYGIIMMNPIFNLPYFLIGMYFGFINYTIHKGIIDINMNNQIFKEIHLDSSMSQDVHIIEKLSLLPHRNTFDEGQNRDTCQLNLFEEDDEDNNILSDNKSIKSNKIVEAQKLEEINQNNRNSINSDNNNSQSRDLRDSKDQIENLSSNTINKKKLKDMPFLKSSISIIEWHRNHNIKYFFIIIIIIISLILVLLNFVNLIFVLIYKSKFQDILEDDQLRTKLSLEKFNMNKALNYIYLVDTEVFVFLVQWLLFIFFMKRQYFFIDFFSNIHWSCFNKSQFSFLIVYSLVILNNLYVSETVVKLNLYNLFLYYFINLFFITIITILVYIIIELPMKKIFKYLLKEEYKIVSITEDIDEEEEEEDEKEDEDENYDIVSKDDDDEDN